MKPTLLNAVSTNQIIHDAASQCASSSIHLILAHLINWLRNEEETQTTARQRREKLLGDPLNRQPPAQGRIAPQSPPVSNPIIGRERAGALVTDAKKTDRPLPLHITAIPTGKSVKCNGCGVVYDLSKTVSCWNACRFIEHPRFNAQCRTREWRAGDVCITWRNFRTDYPEIRQLPALFLSWETWTKKTTADNLVKKGKYEATKRPRDENL